MMEQKPVAWMWLQNSKPVNAFLHDPDVSDEYWQKKQYSKRPLFTADQLKAERDKAIRECAEICEKQATLQSETGASIEVINQAYRCSSDIRNLIINHEEEPE